MSDAPNPLLEGLQVRRRPDSCLLVIFGASGDLTKRMVLPAIFRLARRGLLAPDFRLIGYARTKLTDAEFRALMRTAVGQALGQPRN